MKNEIRCGKGESIYTKQNLSPKLRPSKNRCLPWRCGTLGSPWTTPHCPLAPLHHPPGLDASLLTQMAVLLMQQLRISEPMPVSTSSASLCM